MDKEYRYPCKLSYCIEHQIRVTFECDFPESLRFAIDRFESDQIRFEFGLMAVIATRDAGEIYVGLNSVDRTSCLGRALPTAKQTIWATVSHRTGPASFFHWFVPDCPSTVTPEFLFPFSAVREWVENFMISGRWPDDLQWGIWDRAIQRAST